MLFWRLCSGFHLKYDIVLSLRSLGYFSFVMCQCHLEHKLFSHLSITHSLTLRNIIFTLRHVLKKKLHLFNHLRVIQVSGIIKWIETIKHLSQCCITFLNLIKVKKMLKKSHLLRLSECINKTLQDNLLSIMLVLIFIFFHFQGQPPTVHWSHLPPRPDFARGEGYKA